MTIQAKYSAALLLVIPLLSGCQRFGGGPSSWLMIVISAAAGIAVYLQFLKDW